MAGTQQQLIKYIVIHERSPGLPILYASRSRQQVLPHLPGSPTAISPLQHITDGRDREEVERHHGSQTDNNVIRTDIFIKSKYDEDMLICGISFACGSIGLAMVTAHLNVMRDQRSSTLVMRKYRCILSNSGNSVGGIHNNTEGRNRNRIYSMRSTYQACFVLEEMGTENPSPKIVFATDSINRILDADSCDLQGLPFLCLVTIEDRERAAAFLGKMLDDSELVFEQLHLLVSPLEGSQATDPRCVSVEFMAMGSNDGAIMLCQLVRPWIAGRSENVRYISLEDIISSDPETSDIPEFWDVMESN